VKHKQLSCVMLTQGGEGEDGTTIKICLIELAALHHDEDGWRTAAGEDVTVRQKRRPVVVFFPVTAQVQRKSVRPTVVCIILQLSR
jgi:hypothetical protein